MSDIRTEIISYIENKLKLKWDSIKNTEIDNKVAALNKTIIDENERAAQKTQERAKLRDEYHRKFYTCMQSIKSAILNELTTLQPIIEGRLITRHPWLENEVELIDEDGKLVKPTIKNLFLVKTLQDVLFKLLKNKKKDVKDWNDIEIKENTNFTWDTLVYDPSVCDPLVLEQISKIITKLDNRIEGYPLSNSDFYNDRGLQSFLSTPLTISPTRYDIYRLLKAQYPTKFTPTQLSSEKIFCTKIVPLHKSELIKLKECEWDHLETILLNTGTEDGPKWVLLDKKNRNWTLYTNEIIDEQLGFDGIAPLNNINIVQINHNKCCNTLDWHAVLLSRVLPCTQLPSSNTINIENFRSNIPIEILKQNTIESSCLKEQSVYINKAKQAFALYAPLSDKEKAELYEKPDTTETLFPSIPTPEAKTIISAFEQNKISYDGNQMIIHDANELIEAMKLAYHLNITELTISVVPNRQDKSWFYYNLALTTIHSPNSPNSPNSEDYGFIHACAARNRFINSNQANYLKTGNAIELRKSAWENTGKFIYDYFKSNEVPDEEQLRNIAEMGKDGLDTFFRHLSSLEQAPNLTCSFDLNSGQSIPSAKYIEELKTHIESFTNGKLFGNLELILPDTFNSESQTNFFELLKALDARHELAIIKFKNANNITPKFLTDLNAFVAANKICLQITIPEWDTEAFDADIPKGDLKAQYRVVQNTILTNIRDTRQSNLDANTETITKPEDVIKLKSKTQVSIDTQTWLHTQYQLASTSVGVQQQAQQEVAQEAQQKQDKQSKPQTPTKRAITPYTKGDKLITRTNLGSIDENFFSSLVGSKYDALHIIQKIDKAALQQIQRFPEIFKFGIDPERTPGFRLFYTSEDDKSLILSFDQTLVEQDLLDLKDDPFAIRMNDCKLATTFYGDFRQFEPFSAIGLGVENQETCWHYLSEEQNIPEKIQTWINSNVRGSQTSEALQCYNYLHQIKYAKDQGEMIKIIKTWSTIQDDEFLTEFTNNLTSQNLKAFGQLFYHYGATGNEKLLALAHQIYQKFNDKFSIFKKRLLDHLYDWSEFLEQSEVKALTASIRKLDDQPVYANILWNLVDKHGASVRRMRFAEVWRAYEKVIDYINANDLEINQNEFLNTIEKYQAEFNATQFLRRMYEVLQATGNRQDSNEVQQEILNNLSKIDWHESGFYYACVNEGYRYWDEDLHLEDAPSYISKFDIDLNTVEDANTHTLRYAAQHLKLNKTDFLKFKAIIQKIPNADINLMRLVLASLALGKDSISELEAIDFNYPIDINACNIINNCLHLDPKDLNAGSYHVRIADLPILLQAISANNLDNLDLKKINALGRALQSFKDSDKEQKLNRLITTRDFTSPLFTSFPWLVDDPILNLPPENKHILRFYEQLQTIDFKNSRLPDKATLESMLTTINSKETRQKSIKDLLDSGCVIADQDADYRPLKAEEKTLINELFLAKTFKVRNKELLEKLFENLAVKQGEDENGTISAFLNFCSELDRKNYYNELGQILGLLVEKSQGSKYYSVKQLTTWLSSVFDEETFKNNPYPVTFIKELLTDALTDPSSSLLNNNLHYLKTEELELTGLQTILSEINLNDLQFAAKDTLVKFAIKFKHNEYLLANHIKITNIFKQFKKSEAVTIACADYINQQLEKSPATFLTQIEMLEKIALPCPSNDETLQAVWQDNQIKLFKGLSADTIKIERINALLNTNDNFIRMILIAAFNAKEDDNALIEKIKNSFQFLTKSEKQILAKYYATDPKPKLRDLDTLTAKHTATEMINHFEMVMQPMNKRDYSLIPDNATDILRVLNGIKLKGQPGGITKNEQATLLRLLYHTNSYCQVIKLNEKSYDEILDIISNNKNENTNEAKARILACIREVIVRKTGKWINHTQMLDLIYSALHNDDSLLHQVHMGEGKSIIGLARDVYLAMHGEIIDVYSSKESLSSRDHLDSVAVLDAFGIRHSHITASSQPNEYQNNADRKGIGAVHYATIGNWSLFYSGIRWENKDSNMRIHVFQQNRHARCDEGDYVMRSENTLFNFSDQGDSKTIYNYDAWIYQIAYDFYMERQSKFAKNDFKVLEDEDLQELYKRIADGQITVAPDKSTFFQTYLATGNNDIRNNKLVGLLTAAHLAQKLQSGVDFCVMNEQKKISETSSIDIRFAKVVINNQVYHGSTYSDLVQQFLHVRLNTEAIAQHETPNFFIEPESEIALTANAKFILKNYYAHLEAMTGTAGDEEAVKFYKEEFGVLRVIKLPTHAEIKTTFLAPIYASTEINAEIIAAIEQLEAPALDDNEKLTCNKLIEEYINAGRMLQVEEILKAIDLDPLQPVLITCEDDREVEVLGALIAKSLEQHIPKVVIDTNASGISEAEILKYAGARGAITISSRLGRGSDIVPYERYNGLKVLRTYPATPEVVKQEEGRQGRNGAGGTCQDIINYNAVEVQLQKYRNDHNFAARLIYEQQHLEAKIQKHNTRTKSKPKWEAIKSDKALRDKYLNARTLEYIKHKYKNEAKERLARKDDLLIEGSANVMETLVTLTIAEQDALKRAWNQCRRSIETHWQNDESSRVAIDILQKFYSDNNVHIKPSIKPIAKPQIEIEDDDAEPEKIRELIAFHQSWLHDLDINTLSPEIIATIYGENCEKLDDLYSAFHKLNKEQLAELSALVSNNSMLCHRVTCDAWVQAAQFLAYDSVNFESNLQRIHAFFRKNHPIPNSPQAISDYSQKFIVAVEGAPDVDFILDLVVRYSFDDLNSIISNFSKEVVYLCKNYMNDEDRVFFLNTLRYAHDKSRVLNYLKDNLNNLKQNPAIIRPMLPLLAQENPYPFMNFTFNAPTTPRLLWVLSERPDFIEEEFNFFKDKVDRILLPENKIKFLELLSTIPPFVSMRSILNDLSELPSACFDTSYEKLENRIKKIQEMAETFNDFLFTNDIITNMNTPYIPANKEAFNIWQEIYFRMPLENRKIFFTEIQKIDGVAIDKLQELAKNYINSRSNVQLKHEISLLQKPAKAVANKENTQPTAPKPSEPQSKKTPELNSTEEVKSTKSRFFGGRW